MIAADLDLGARFQPLPAAHCTTNPAAHARGCSGPVAPWPMVLVENGEPTYLFGAADGYRKDGGASANIQIPLGR